MNNNSQKQLDLRLGNPDFLQEYWEKNPLSSIPNLGMSYKDCWNKEELKSNIVKLHKKIGNFDFNSGYEIIITNGATHALNACINVIGQKASNFVVVAPDYYKYKDFCNLNDVNLYSGIDVVWNIKPSYQLISIPNNPLGDLPGLFNFNKIQDLCYNWPQYFNTPNIKGPYIATPDDPSIFSLAKATGHASTRIGWIITNQIELIIKLNDYVENSVNGISIESQWKANEIIKHQLSIEQTVFDYGERILTNRWKRINKMKNRLPFQILNENGMFLWCEGTCPNKLLPMEGSAFGATNHNFRLNLGCSSEDFDKLIKILKLNSL